MDNSPDASIAPSAPLGRSVAGRRIDWTGTDLVLGVVWFIALFVVIPLPIAGVTLLFLDRNSPGFAAASFIIGAGSEIGIVAAAAMLTFGKYGGGWGRLGFVAPGWSAAGWALAAFAGAMALSIAYGVMVENIGALDFLKSDCAQQIPRVVREHRWVLAVASFMVIVVAPPCEEIFFRGFLFTGMAKRWGLAAGILVSALVFAGAHLDYRSFVPILGVGACFAFAYSRSRNILSTMAAHVAFNSISIAAIAAGTCDKSNSIGAPWLGAAHAAAGALRAGSWL
jgi:membrane protease YdiL (CAAX protease family)